MKFNFKKITPILVSAVLLGSTIGFATVAADLAAYPSPFVASGAADLSIVYGIDGQAKDMEAAGLFSSDLASELADQTASTASSSTSLSGESVNLGTSNTKLYMYGELDKAKPTISKTEMPTLLADGKVLDDSGTEYTYTQTLKMANAGNTGRNITFGKSGEAIDPIVMIDLGYSTTYPVYNYTLTFTKQINVSHTDVQGNTLKIMGVDYTIGASSDYNVLYLYGAGTSITVNEGEEKTVTVAGTDHTLLLEGTDTATTGVMIFDGVRKAVTEGNSYKFSGEVEVYVKDLFHQTKTGVSSSGEFLVGSTKLRLDGGSSVKKGADETAILNTVVTIDAVAAAAKNKITGLSIAQAASTAIGDYLAVGGSYVDRVFPNIKVEFASLSPALDSTSRDEVIIEGNSANAQVTFTSALANKPFTFNFAHDIDNIGSNAVSVTKLSDTANYTIHVVENSTMNLNEYIVVDAGDKGRILRLTQLGPCTSANDETIFQDVITGESFKFITGNINNYSMSTIDGQPYYVQINSNGPNGGGNTGNVTMNWGTSSTYNTPGKLSVFPKIKLAKGGWLAFMTETLISNTTAILPGYEVLTTHEAGQAMVVTSTVYNEPDDLNGKGGVQYGRVNYTLVNSSVDDEDSVVTGYLNLSIIGIDVGEDGWSATADCNFTSGVVKSTMPMVKVGANPQAVDVDLYSQGTGAAILLLEEHKLGETDGDAICVPLSVTGTNDIHIAVGAALSTDLNDMGTWAMQTLSSNSYKSQQVDIYGTWIERDTASGTDYKVTLKYPDEQMIADVFVAEVASESTTTVSSSGITKLGDVLLTDTEAESSKPSTNLIVVGGSAVNQVSAKLLGLTYPTKGGSQEWQDATGVTGEGQAIIKLFANPYSAAKKAMLIAGWEADDTIAAAKQVINKKSTLSDLDSKVIKKGVDYS